MMTPCPRCEGRGWYSVWARSTSGGHIEAQEQCEDCWGTGDLTEVNQHLWEEYCDLMQKQYLTEIDAEQRERKQEPY